MMIPLRPPEDVMRLSVLGSFTQTRLSFMRVLLRSLKNDQWRFSRPLWNINNKGQGIAVYRAENDNRAYSLAVFSRDLPSHLRSDRVIASAWDAAFTLFDGIPSSRDLARMQKQVPLQEAGRNDSRQIVLSRANKSIRAFDSAVASLARGQGAPNELLQTGYLMRTTAVYGNGKFGIADRARIADRPEFAAPFSAEMLAVFLFREFPADLCQHLAASRSRRASCFSDNERRNLGIGNSTGLGMAPFLVNHPILLHKWIFARETALARVRSLASAGKEQAASFLSLVKRARKQSASWSVADAGQTQKNKRTARDLQKFLRHWNVENITGARRPWNCAYQWADQHLSCEGREMLISLLIESHGELVDDLAAQTAGDESFAVNGGMTVLQMRRLIARRYQWIAKDPFKKMQKSAARFWYVSEEKLEPRLGERFAEPGAELELPLAIMRDMRAFNFALQAAPGKESLAMFLMRHPEHRAVAKRAQIAEQSVYCEIQNNLIADDMLPLNLLRCKLSFFGATGFDPRSDRWLRINMFRGAPRPCQLSEMPADDWAWQAAT